MGVALDLGFPAASGRLVRRLQLSDAKVLGFADLDGDGRSNVVLQYTCFGSLPEQCCAGRTPQITFVAALAVGDDRGLRRIGPVLRDGRWATA